MLGVEAAKTRKSCSKCGTEKPICDFYAAGKKTDGTPKRNSWCSACIKEKMAAYRKRKWGNDGLHFNAFMRTKTPRSYLSYLLGKARSRHECSIDIDHLCTLWDRQNGLCAITGWTMTMQLENGVVPTNTSIDRIDSNIGYVFGNVQLVCRCVNIAKHNLSMTSFVEMCTAVTKERENG